MPILERPEGAERLLARCFECGDVVDPPMGSLRETVMQNFKKLAIAMAAVWALVLATPAMALDANDFAKKLSELFAYAGTDIAYDSATAQGDRVVLEGVRLDLGSEKPSQYKTKLVVSGVVERPDGSYTAAEARLDDIELDEEGTTISVRNIRFADLQIAADPAADPLASMRLYKQFNAGPLEVKSAGKTELEVADISANTEFSANDTIAKSRYRLDGMRLDPSAFEDAEMTKTLAAYGLETITGRFYGNADWDVNSGRLDLGQSTFELDKLGKLDVSGFITGYDLDMVKQMIAMQREMRGSDRAKMSQQQMDEMDMKLLALFGQKLKLGLLKLRYDDAGLAPKVLENMAAESGMPATALGGFYAGMAGAMAAQFGLPETVQKQISSALTRFFDNPQNLTISITPDTPIAFSKLTGLAEDPAAAAQTLNLTVVANQ